MYAPTRRCATLRPAEPATTGQARVDTGLDSIRAAACEVPMNGGSAMYRANHLDSGYIRDASGSVITPIA